MTGSTSPTTLRWAILIAFSLLAGYATYQLSQPDDAGTRPLLERVYPAESGSLRLLGRSFSLASEDNPLRREALALMARDAKQGWIRYNELVEAGRARFQHSCFPCHGDWLEGQPPPAEGDRPRLMRTAFPLWRIDTRQAGAAKATKAEQPIAHRRLEETHVWQILAFLADRIGDVPPGGARRGGVTLMGRELYQHRCAACHGKEGEGDGPAAERMYPKPRDFSLALFKYKTTPGLLLPRDEDLFDMIKHGLAGSGMPAWGELLSDAQIESLIPVIKSFDITHAWAPEDADEEDFDKDDRYLKTDFRRITESEPVDGQIPFSESSAARGKVVFEKICASCHGLEGRGNIASAKRLEDDWDDRIWPRDLTKPWTWRMTQASGPEAESRDRTIRNIYIRLSIGLPGTPMPAHRATELINRDPIPDEDRWHVANYVYTLREKSLPPAELPLIQAWRIAGPLPADPDDEAWQRAPAVTLPLVPGIIKQEHLSTPLNDAITVRALYNDLDIAFLLEVNDRTDSRPGERVSMRLQDRRYRLYSDALAIRFPTASTIADSGPLMRAPQYSHADERNSANLWYWNAGSLEPPQPAANLLLDAEGPDQRLTLRKGENDFHARGEWQHGRWRVLMQNRREGTERRDIDFAEGIPIPVSLVNWDGSNGEALYRHTRSPWYWLVLSPPPEPDHSLSQAIGVAIGVLLLGFLLMRGQWRRD